VQCGELVFFELDAKLGFFLNLSPIKAESSLFLFLRFTDTHLKTFSSNINVVPVINSVVNNRHYRPENGTHRVFFTSNVLHINPGSINKLLFAEVDGIFFRIFQF